MRKILSFLLPVFLLLVATDVWGTAATLPFSYDNGKPSNVTGFTHSGLGSDYGSSPKMRFDTQGDCVTLNFDAQPGQLTFKVKMNGTKASNISFTLSTSSDGIEYSVLKTYGSSELPNQNGTTTFTVNENEFPAGTRYLCWIYANKGTSGNLGFGNINLALGAPSFNLAGGTYSGSQTLTISTYSGYTLKYSTDNSDPKSSGTAISIASNIANVTVDESMTVKAVAVSAGSNYSAITSADYTILDASTPHATVNVETINFGYVEVGKSKDMIFKVTPANLTKDLTISCNNNKYSLDVTSIDKDETEEQTITVTAAPSALNDNMDGKITISSDELASDIEITISATPYIVSNVTLNATGGVIKEGDEVKTSITARVGETITLTAIPNSGYVFNSWSASGATPASSSDAETEFTLSSATVTLTASFIVDPYNYATLEESDITSVSNAGSGYGTVKSVTKAGLTWSTDGYQTDQNGVNNKMIQLKAVSSGSPYLKLPDFSGKIQTISFSVTSAANGATSKGSTTTTARFSFSTSASGDAIVTSTNGATKEIVLDLSGEAESYSTGYITSSGGARIWDVSVTYLPTINIQKACTDGTKFYSTYSNERAFVVPSEITVSGVKMEDGHLVIMDYTTGDVVPASTGVLISVASITGEVYDSYDISLSNEAGTAKTGNLLKAGGITASEMAAEDDPDDYYFYKLALNNAAEASSAGFYWGAESGAQFASGANKAYLVVDKNDVSTAPSIIRIVDEENGATNVEAIEAVEEGVKFFQDGRLYIKKNGVVYDALGQMVK